MATWRKTLSSNQYYEVIINVDQDSQNIANNTSNISWSLQVRKSFGSGFWGADSTASTWTVNIDGTNVSSSSSSYDFRGGAPLIKTIASGTRTITHGEDGSKSIAVSGYWKDNANGLGNATASGTFTLNTIPRASELTAFSFASHLKNDVANTINYTVSKKSTNFRHQIQLRDGSTTVFQWDNISSDGASTITLTASDVNTLLTRMPTSTTKTFTLRIATRNGVNGGWIGSAVTMNATATVDGNVKPTISGQAFGISDVRVDQAMGKYIQGFTKVDALFTPTSGYGSSIQASSMTVQKTDGSDSQVISGTIGTTGREVLYSGEYRVIYTTTDTRGRSTSATSSNFIVHAYSAPVISAINLFRYEATPETVYVGVAGHFSSLDTSNVATLRIERKNGDTWEQVTTDHASVTGLIHKEVNVPDNSITSSYEYRAILTDYVNGRAEVIDTISTQQIVMDIYRNQGVAFGKFYEPEVGGSLQVDGQIFKDGEEQEFNKQVIQYGDLNTAVKSGAYRVNSSANIANMFPNGDWSTMLTVFGGGDTLAQMGFPYYNGDSPSFRGGTVSNGVGNFSPWKQLISESGGAITGRLSVNGSDTKGLGIVMQDTNTSGTYIKFDDGTMICWENGFTQGGGIVATNAEGILYRSGHAIWSFPATFMQWPIAFGTANGNWKTWVTTDNLLTGSCSFITWASTANQVTPSLNVMAIGRWK